VSVVKISSVLLERSRDPALSSGAPVPQPTSPSVQAPGPSVDGGAELLILIARFPIRQGKRKPGKHPGGVAHRVTSPRGDPKRKLKIADREQKWKLTLDFERRPLEPSIHTYSAMHLPF
jgi:hypothetical protein